MGPLKCVVEDDGLNIQPYYCGGGGMQEKESHINVYNHQVYKCFVK
jgi:hypothetical protein